MSVLGKSEIVAALTRLGELAQREGLKVELLLLGGCAMVLGFEARLSTRDVDAVVVSPPDRAPIRRLVETIAKERDWAPDWLNDGAKGFVTSLDAGKTVLVAPGIRVRIPPLEALLAMKLCAWRDDLDIADARRLLSEIETSRQEGWVRVAKYLQPGRELKAKLAFDDLWEDVHGST
ncbi:MAG: hypothetical protein JNG88_05495 [Phycisphaerales bacterium]|nr:hypothetical protein [Phycisphaerales bacterium]